MTRRRFALWLAVPPNPNYKFTLNIDKVRFLTTSIAVVDATAYDGKMAT